MADDGAATEQQQQEEEEEEEDDEDEDEAAGASGLGREQGPRGRGRPPTVRDLQSLPTLRDFMDQPMPELSVCQLSIVYSFKCVVYEKHLPRIDSCYPNPETACHLALAGLYEDEIKRQPSHLDKPTARVASHPRLTVQRSLRKPERSMSDDKDNQRFCSSDSEYRIVGPSNITSSKIVDELFKEAREHGAVPLDEVSRASGDCPKAKSFSGGGYRLGDSTRKRSEYIYGENQFGQEVQILLKLWRNGFSLDDGELRSYTDPVNAQFLESVKRGEIPAELQRLVHGGQVNLDMEDHQEQEYVRPRLKFKAFSGEGQKLGSLTPEIVSTPSSPEEEEKSFLDAALLIDDSVPTTKIQIRLADGSRLIQRFNKTHRIIDIRNFIIQSRPLFATTDFVLLTTFPHKELTDESLTLQESDILNTVILQQLK